MTWRMEIPIPDDMWMSANRDYGHGGWKKRIVNGLQQLTHFYVLQQQPGPLPDPCMIVWTVRYPKGTGRKADPENSAPTCKAILDQIVNEGLIADDNPDHIVVRAWQRGANLPGKGHTLVLTAISQEVPF